ncbi:MAG: (4Fe-4S)-binding protein [Lachnospiraceae bacterium]|nr:(4Fe-4S)-binding protein [Lachnospiraceae bacterium]
MTHEELIADGYKAYENEGLAVYWKPSICAHAGECVRGDGEVFNFARRPWIILDEAKNEKVAEIVSRCPSGALKFIKKG